MLRALLCAISTQSRNGAHDEQQDAWPSSCGARWQPFAQHQTAASSAPSRSCDNWAVVRILMPNLFQLRRLQRLGVFVCSAHSSVMAPLFPDLIGLVPVIRHLQVFEVGPALFDREALHLVRIGSGWILLDPDVADTDCNSCQLEHLRLITSCLICLSASPKTPPAMVQQPTDARCSLSHI